MNLRSADVPQRLTRGPACGGGGHHVIDQQDAQAAVEVAICAKGTGEVLSAGSGFQACLGSGISYSSESPRSQWRVEGGGERRGEQRRLVVAALRQAAAVEWHGHDDVHDWKLCGQARQDESEWSRQVRAAALEAQARRGGWAAVLKHSANRVKWGRILQAPAAQMIRAGAFMG